ncbi:MAG: hypothetical protein AB1796_06510 [Bacillota bacterium]
MTETTANTWWPYPQAACLDTSGCREPQPILRYIHGAGHAHRVQGTLNRVLATSLLVGIIFFILLRRQAEAMAALISSGHAEALELTQCVARL